MKVTLRHLEWLQVETDSNCSFGYNQDWYGTEWQRLAGCGPTTATQLINYISCRDGYIEPSELKEKNQIIESMEQVFPYVRPRRGGGLYKTRWMKDGLDKYIQERSWPYETKMLRVYPFLVMRPNIKEVANFILEGLLLDCPIAFLNRHKGQEEGLDTWHWVPIVALEQCGDNYIASVYDAEQIRYFSVNSWLRDTVLGGGFVYLKRRKGN